MFSVRSGLGRAILASATFALAAACVQAQHLPIKSYATADGLAHNLVFRIVRDSRGYLWFCTREGLSRFDGYRFTNYTTEQGLPQGDIRDLLEIRSHAYWVATADGLYRFNPNSSRSRNPAEPMFVAYRPNERPARFITKLYEDHTGTLWVGTIGGLYRLEETNAHVKFHFVELGMPREAFDGSVVETILEDRRGALWVGTRGSGLYRRLPDGGVEHYTIRHALPSNRVNALLEDREGRLWVGTTLGLCLLVAEPDSNRPVVARVYTQKDFGLLNGWVEALLQSPDGRIWLAIEVGLSEFTPAGSGAEPKFKSYTTAHGLSHLDLTSLAEDSAGNLWIGTTGGAMKLARNGFITYTEAPGAPSPLAVSSIFESGSGELYFISRDQSGRRCLIRYDEKGLSIIQPNFPKRVTYFGWGWNQIALQDHLGEWWIATGQGLCRFPRVSRIEQLARTRPKAVYTTKDGLAADDVWRIYEDSRGDMWVASFSQTQSGLARWERATETFHRYTEAHRAGAFCEDASGNIWIGMGGALTRYSSGRFTVFTAADGLPASRFYALHLDPAGRLWIATDAGGLSRVDNPAAERPSFVTYTTANGLSTNQVMCVTSDLQGRIYASTGRGLDRLDPVTGQVRHYTSADGLVGNLTGVAFRDRHGVLWFGTDLGVSRLIPEPDSAESPPPIFISGLHIVGEKHPLSELGETEVPEIRLGPSENQIQIDFVGVNSATGEQLRYQYRLEGAHADWSAPTDQRSINYAHLSPGSYRFLVRAVTNEGTTSQAPATVSVTILPPIWQRWWFVTLSATLTGLITYTAYRYRLARVVELERMRTRIAADLHDDIGASLSRMAILSEVVKRQVASSAQESVTALTEIGDSARGLVGSMREIVWAIDSRRDDLGSVISRIRMFASDLLEGNGIQWEFCHPPESERIKLGPDQRRHIFLFFKEAINNAARHAACNTVWITIDVTRHRLIGEVRDDGQGFAPAERIGDSGGGHGLENMQRRVKQLRGTLMINSSPGQGTHLKLTIPL